MALELLTTTTTVWIIDTLFQLVSSGIKIFFSTLVLPFHNFEWSFARQHSLLYV